jgi:glycosyltransferase involved in cell wall biosynthesis
MLSILIPIYNFNAVPLVKELQKQCMECDLEFEIICIDDCSTLHQQENQAISSIEKCSRSS